MNVGGDRHFSFFASPPERNVLLLSCIDLRLADDTVRFMNGENLENRYDHLTLAGAAAAPVLIDALKNKPLVQPKPTRGRPAQSAPNGGCSLASDHVIELFVQHLVFAVGEHDVHDVYILQHRNCGAVKAIRRKPFPANAAGSSA